MIKIFNQIGTELDYKEFLFPGGEVYVKANSNHHRFFEEATSIRLKAKLTNSNEVIKLAMLKDALGEIPVRLDMHYVPYGRQDRRCNPGESFSLKVFCNFINSLDFKEVYIADPHSEVTPALINNVRVITQANIFHQWDELGKRVLEGLTFVSPDAGANKKVGILASYFQHENFIRADKLRDLTTGEIKETVIYCDDLNGRDVMIVDDICDGGRTFIEIAKALKAKNCGKVVLYVTHGIFSKGHSILKENGIDEIWTTDSYCEMTLSYVHTYKL